MSLEGYEVRGPNVKFKVLAGPSNITGKDLQDRLVRFVYEDEPTRKSKLPRVTMDFDNTDGKILNAAVPIIGLTLKVTFGYNQNRSRPFRVVVSRIKANIVRDAGGGTRTPAPNAYGLVTLEAKAYNPKLHWRPNENIGTFRNMTPSQIARQVARQSGFSEKKIFIQDTDLTGNPQEPIEEVSMEEDETVLQFVKRLAAEQGFEGFEAKVSRGEFHFGSPKNIPQPIEEIAFFKGPDLLEFNIDGDYRVNVNKVTGRGYNPKTGTAVVTDASGNVGSVVRFKPSRQNSDVTESLSKNDVIVSVDSRVNAKTLARLASHIRRKWKINMKIVGNPRCFAGFMLQLENFGPFVNGKWYIEGSRHTFDQDGYTTELKLRARYSKKRGGPKRPVVITSPSGDIIGVIHVDTAKRQFGVKKKKRRGRRTTKQ